MFAKFLTTAAISLAAIAASAPASAQSWDQRSSGYDRRGDYGYQQVDYRRDRRGYRNNRSQYRGNRRCYDKGNGGLAIGGIAGGLLGHEIAGRGDRTLGAILGAGVGALAGRAIDKSDGARC
jgi:uncharacterized protein YcfJ